jgi:membrane-associated phospholipid phosphatase
MNGSRPFIAWPGWPFLRFAWLLSLANAVWFEFVFWGCNWITAHRSLRVPIHLPFELSIPLIPGAVLGYLSIYAIFLLGPFVIREKSEFARLIGALAATTFVAGLGFLLVPSRAAFPPPGDVGMWTGLLRSARSVALEYNMVPSLHVALSVCCLAAYARRARPRTRFALWTWASAVALSTIFTHQHHIVDVVTGWILGVVAYRRIVPLSTRH